MHQQALDTWMLLPSHDFEPKFIAHDQLLLVTELYKFIHLPVQVIVLYMIQSEDEKKSTIFTLISCCTYRKI